MILSTVGALADIILGVELLDRYIDSDKNVGGLTGAKTLLTKMYAKFHHFADVIVADALYCCAPFIHLVTGRGMDVVVRVKDETRAVFQNAMADLKQSWYYPRG